VVDQLPDLDPDVARREAVGVVLALVVVPRAVALAEVSDDVAAEVLRATVLLDRLVAIAEEVRPLEDELLPTPPGSAPAVA
jgi:hypothetical protein